MPRVSHNSQLSPYPIGPEESPRYPLCKFDPPLFGSCHLSGRGCHRDQYLGTTEKCRFMDKRVCEILCFFVAPPRVFPLSVWRVSRTLLYRNTSTSVHPEFRTKLNTSQRNTSPTQELFSTEGRHFSPRFYFLCPAYLP